MESEHRSSTSEGGKSMLNLTDHQCALLSKEPCPICLSSTEYKRIGLPNKCRHKFCLRCLKTWSKRTNTCPLCRTKFRSIIVRSRYSRRYLKKITIRRAIVEAEEQNQRIAAFLATIRMVISQVMGRIWVHV